MKQYLLLIIFFTTVATVATAQATHEFSVYGMGGLSGIRYTMDEGTVKSGIGGGGGVGYTLFLDPQWGLSTGVELQLLNAKATAATINDHQQVSYAYDGQTETMMFNLAYTNYEEKQRITYLQIPLMLQYQTTAKHKYYAAAGAKLGFAVKGSYKASASQLSTSGYFPESGQTFTNMPNHGFTTLHNPAVEDDLDIGLNVMLALETGMRWQLGEAFALYTGVYLDYGVPDVSPEQTDQSIVNYQPATADHFGYNSMLTAQYIRGNGPFVDKVNTLSAGIKVKIAWSGAIQQR